MLILSLSYLKSTDEADRFMEPHIAWLDEGYERGLFIASGRKVPRSGGMILAKGDRAAIEAFVAADPFVIKGIAAYDVVEVALSRTAAGLEGLKDCTP